MISALKHHVFKEMSKTGFADFFPCRSDMISNVYLNYRVTMIFVNDKGQAIWQNIFFVGDNQFRSFLTYFFNEPGLRLQYSDRRGEEQADYHWFHGMLR